MAIVLPLRIASRPRGQQYAGAGCRTCGNKLGAAQERCPGL